MTRLAKISALPHKRRDRATPSAATAAALCLVTLLVSTQAPATDLRVTVDGIRGDQGKVMVALHTPKPDITFPNAAGTVAGQWQTARSGTLEFVFTGLPTGRFAVAVFHDENDNGELDVNFVGIPKEGYAFSQNARGFAGPPSFDAAAVEVSEDNGRQTTTAKMGY